MDFKQLTSRAVEIRQKYSNLEMKKYGREWTREEINQGFVGDVGDLTKLVMAKSGIRNSDGNLDEKIAHELSDCLWSIIILANKYNVDLEKSFLDTMDYLEDRINGEIK